MKNNTTLCILGAGLLACVEPLDSQNADNPDKNPDGTSKKPGNINDAFDQVVQVLHAPYAKGTLFFRIFTGDIATEESKKGDKSEKIGNSQNNASNAGSGIWTVIAGKDNEITDQDNSIVYEYKNYQPKGSAIHVNGKMEAMYRSTGGDFDCDDAIGFNLAGGIAISNAIDNAIDDAGVDASPDTVNTAAMTALSKAIEDGIARTIDTLTIDGAYKAVLKFTYTGIVIHADITESNYDTELFGNLGMFMTTGSKKIGPFTLTGSRVEFTYARSKIEFTYADETMTLNQVQLKKLLRVAI